MGGLQARRSPWKNIFWLSNGCWRWLWVHTWSGWFLGGPLFGNTSTQGESVNYFSIFRHWLLPKSQWVSSTRHTCTSVGSIIMIKPPRQNYLRLRSRTKWNRISMDESRRATTHYSASGALTERQLHLDTEDRLFYVWAGRLKVVCWITSDIVVRHRDLALETQLAMHHEQFAWQAVSTWVGYWNPSIGRTINVHTE